MLQGTNWVRPTSNSRELPRAGEEASLAEREVREGRAPKVAADVSSDECLIVRFDGTPCDRHQATVVPHVDACQVQPHVLDGDVRVQDADDVVDAKFARTFAQARLVVGGISVVWYEVPTPRPQRGGILEQRVLE